ncbi:MAG: FAD-binding oxidoreductase [Deltaproteobacteria bacterium]|nr:FAD-binding oxidoreductase [Deltaproteobacteria bacterium]
MDDFLKKRLVPPPVQENGSTKESLDTWGFADTQFRFNHQGNLELTGKHYPLCEEELPYLLPWISKVMEFAVDPKEVHASHYPTEIPSPIVNESFFSDLQKNFSPNQWTQEPNIRLRHGHGHTQHEMYAIKYGQLGRVPDLVLYPAAQEEVTKLVALANQHNVCLIPYGGGTSVTQALQCPDNETRMIVSVDMKRMNRILWVDPVNRIACIEAGAVGRHLSEQLAKTGFTLGHEPDSIEFSTLGGWIATHASGMKKNKYGNIEDIVLDFNVVTANGDLKRSSVAPRESVGADPRLWLFGSEGNFGIITQAIVKIFPLPETQKYGSVIFPTFEEGFHFMYELSATDAIPASVRLVDNMQFQFGQALKPRKQGLPILKSRLEKFFVTKIKGFDPEKMVACTLVFEGSASEVARQEQAVYRIAKQHGGMKAGAENGRRGYQLTFSIAYIRDFVMKHYVIAESFETSVPWSQALSLCENVKRRLHEECSRRQIPGKPFVTCRLTQIYETGVCIYFYFGFRHKGIENPSQVYGEIEEMAREEILTSGGSLSHHHGIGKLRQKFLKDIQSEETLRWKREVKRAIDPKNIFGASNQSL